MMTYNPTAKRQPIADSITWDVIDEAKSHFKSVLNRIDAEKKIQLLKTN